MKRIYFDNAATTPLSSEVKSFMIESLDKYFGNPSSIYAEGREVRAAIEQARKIVANTIGSSIGEVFFTSGGTESNNMALKCAVRDLGVTRIISSPIEHPCVLHSLEAINKEQSIEIQMVDVDSKGVVDVTHLETLLKKNNAKTLVTLMHSNNEIGTMIDLETIGMLCEAHGALFHSDTVQTMGYFPIDVQKSKLAFLSGSAHKFYGPKGIGFIYINGDNIVKPILDGGSQERNMRAGTENIYGIMAVGRALEVANQKREEWQQQVLKLRAYFIQKLKENIAGVQFNGNLEGLNHYKVLSVSFPPSEMGSTLIFNLDMEGISASGGSACSSGSDAGSHVLTALGASPDRATVRFSLSHSNTKDEVDRVVEVLKEIY